MFVKPFHLGGGLLGFFHTLFGSIRIKPELEGNIQNLGGHDLGTATDSDLGQGGQLGDVADHVGVAELMTSGLGQLVPDVEPRIILVFRTGTDYLLKGNPGSPKPLLHKRV